MSTVIATYSGFVGHNGVPVQLHDGDEYDSSHPLVQANPHMFGEPAKVVGKATAAKTTPAKPGAKDG
jgi:hypothetical protein